MIRFYKGLKDNVKDDFYRKDMPDTLVKYIQCTVKIDNRLYIYYIKKRGQRPLMLR